MDENDISVTKFLDKDDNHYDLHRLTYSLAVIMLETTQSINNFLPTLLAIGVSMGVAKCINRSLYEYAIRMK